MDTDLAFRIMARYQRRLMAAMKPKDVFLDAVKDQLGFARIVWGQLRNISKAATLIWKVMDDCNAREEAKITQAALGSLVVEDFDLDEIRTRVPGISRAIGWDVIAASAFGVALMEVAGQKTASRKLFTALLKEVGQYL